MLWLFKGFKGCCGCSLDALGFFGFGWFFTDPGGSSDLDNPKLIFVVLQDMDGSSGFSTHTYISTSQRS
jgi:hypothetical protein